MITLPRPTRFTAEDLPDIASSILVDDQAIDGLVDGTYRSVLIYAHVLVSVWVGVLPSGEFYLVLGNQDWIVDDLKAIEPQIIEYMGAELGGGPSS